MSVTSHEHAQAGRVQGGRHSIDSSAATFLNLLSRDLQGVLDSRMEGVWATASNLGDFVSEKRFRSRKVKEPEELAQGHRWRCYRRPSHLDHHPCMLQFNGEWSRLFHRNSRYVKKGPTGQSPIPQTPPKTTECLPGPPPALWARHPAQTTRWLRTRKAQNTQNMQQSACEARRLFKGCC